MIVTPVKAHKISSADTNINDVLDKYVDSLKERSVVSVTSKIVAICEDSGFSTLLC
jgi:F420-0:gamma-glutamyl ligase